jgi:putative ABC transport system permease protein
LAFAWIDLGILFRMFLVLWAISNLIAWPLAYYIMERWLNEFPYRTEMGLLSFLTAAILMLVIGFATVSYRSIRAAVADPVHSLRYE